MREVETAKKAGLPVGLLYAVGGDCETEQVLATVTHTNGATGSFTLSREVSETLVTYELASDGLVVPVPEEGALTFSVAFTAASGYEYDSEMTVTDADGTTSPMTNGEITVSADMSIEAAVTATVYEFAIDMNAGSADLFYVGQPVTNVVMHVTDNAAAKTLPTNVYRRDACLDGFAFTDNATGGYKQLDAAFVSAYE